MSLLIPITELTNRQGANLNPVPKLYGVPSIAKIRERGSSSVIIMDGKEIKKGISLVTFQSILIL